MRRPCSRPSRRAPWGVAVLAAAGALVLGAGPAAAHVGTEATSTAAGGGSIVRFTIGHGCDGSPTTAVRIQMPEGVTGVHAEAAPGWDATVGDTEVAWTGGSLPDDQFAQFGLKLTLPETPGETVWFPTVQTCEQGELAWIQIPVEGEAEPDEPAPGVALTASTGDEHGADEGASTAPVSAGPDDGTDPVAVVALVLGALGLVVGGAGLAVARRSRP